MNKVRQIMASKKERWTMKKSYVCSLVQIGFSLGKNVLEPCPMRVFQWSYPKKKYLEVL
jgi:hypothetical protein